LLESRGGDLPAILPVMALYAFAGSRLLPALQAVYKALSALRFGKPALDTLYLEFTEVGFGTASHGDAPAPVRSGKFALEDRLEFSNVSYIFPNAEAPALKDISVTIKARTTVALVGSTGAGKTTLADVILGLLPPSSGDVRVDGVSLTAENIPSWQCNIGYVPQHIFLADDTVAGNIAFGVPIEEIDHSAVERAARIAEVHDFIVSRMAEGYQTFVGERGIRLSGGQRQRIGIARALYHDPDVLVLDEATSALDNLTERAVMDAVHNLGHRKTIIIIAHRTSTVRECDRIFMLQHGSLTGEGTYDEMLESNEQFRRLVTGGALDAV